MNINILENQLRNLGYSHIEVEEWINDDGNSIAIVGYNHETRLDNEWMSMVADDIKALGYHPSYTECSHILFVER